MNCEKTISFLSSGNEFLPTTYSPNQRGEQVVNKSNHPITPALSRVGPQTYSPRQIVKADGGEQLFGPVLPRAGAIKGVWAIRTEQKTTRGGWSALVEKKLSGDRFGFGRSFGLSLGFGGCFLALQIGSPPFPFLSFVVLLAHKALYIPKAFRLFEGL